MPEITDLNKIEEVKDFLMTMYGIDEAEAQVQAEKIEEMNKKLEESNYIDNYAK